MIWGYPPSPFGSLPGANLPDPGEIAGLGRIPAGPDRRALPPRGAAPKMPFDRPEARNEGKDAGHDQDSRDQAFSRSEAWNLRPAQEGYGVPDARLSGELHPVDLRFARGFSGQDARRRRGRALLQPRGDPDRGPDRRRQRLRPHRDRQGRHPVDAGGLRDDPASRGLRRDHPVGEPQSRRPGRRLRRQIQHRRGRAGAGEGDRGDLRPHQDDRGLQDFRRARFRHRRARRDRPSKARRSRSSIRSRNMSGS